MGKYLISVFRDITGMLLFCVSDKAITIVFALDRNSEGNVAFNLALVFSSIQTIYSYNVTQSISKYIFLHALTFVQLKL